MRHSLPLARSLHQMTQPLQPMHTAHSAAATPRGPTDTRYRGEPSSDRVVAEEAVRGEHLQYIYLPNTARDALRLIIDKDATLVARHNPIPVAVHWQDEVKAGLDDDVRLGVLEKVPVCDRVTWCHRMVICAKKNGTPRRTVDCQALNVYAA